MTTATLVTLILPLRTLLQEPFQEVEIVAKVVQPPLDSLALHLPGLHQGHDGIPVLRGIDRPDLDWRHAYIGCCGLEVHQPISGSAGGGRTPWRPESILTSPSNPHPVIKL